MNTKENQAVPIELVQKNPVATKSLGKSVYKEDMDFYGSWAGLAPKYAPEHTLLAEFVYGKANRITVRREAFSILHRYVANSCSHGRKGLSSDPDCRVDELIDAAYQNLVESEKYTDDDLKDMSRLEFNRRFRNAMFNQFRNEIGGAEIGRMPQNDHGYNILYPWYQECIDPPFEDKDGNGAEDGDVNDLSKYTQMEKGDGLDELFEDFDSAVENCKPRCCGDIPCMLFIAGCLLLTAEDNNTSDSETKSAKAQENYSEGILQGVFGMTHEELIEAHKCLAYDEEVKELYKFAVRNPQQYLQRCHELFRCSLFFDKLEEAIQNQSSLV